MVYSIDATQLKNLYSISGFSLSEAFSVDGDIVYSKSVNYDYDEYTISNLFQYPVTKMQGFAVYDGKIAQVREDYGLQIIDINTHQKIKEISMDMGHGNSCQFSDEYYVDGDEFPLFYIRNSGVWVYRIVGTESMLIRKYSFSTDIIGTYVAGFGIDSENRRFYTASYTEGDYVSKTGLLRICEWDMDNTIEVSDGVYTMTLIRENDFTWFDRFDAVQGCCFFDGHFFISTGISGNQYVVLVDSSTLEISNVVHIDTSGEIEGCAWFDNDYMIVSQRLNPYTYKKVIFAQISGDET